MQLLQYQPPGKLGGLFVGRDNRILLMPLSIQNALSEEITADMVRRPSYFKSGGSFKSTGCDASCALRIKGKALSKSRYWDRLDIGTGAPVSAPA